MDNKEYIYPWGYDYDGDSGTGMIKPPHFPGGVDEEELNEAIGSAVTKLVNNAPASLDTFGEIAEALENDESVTATLINTIASKVSQEEYDADKENFATKDEIPTVPTKLSELDNDVNFVTEDTLSEYAKADEVYTKTEADEKFLTEHQDISNLATKEEVENVESEIPTKLSQLENDTDFVSEDSVDEKISQSLEGVATQEWVDEQGYLTEHQSLDDYATKEEVEEADDEVLTNILNRVWSNTDKEVSGYFQTKYTNADGSYAQIWNESDGGGSLYENKTAGIKTYVGVNADGADGVCAQIYSKHVSNNTGSRLNVNPNGIFYGVGNSASMKPEEELAVKGDIPTKVSQLTNDSGYLTEHQSLAEYINAVSYNEGSKEIEFKNGENVIATIDTQDFIKDGMVQSVTIDGGNLVITFNTDAGKQPISIALTDIFNPANYYTKDETDTKLSEKANISDLSEVATSGSYNDLSDKPENVSAFTNDAGYLTEHQSLADYPTKTEMQTADNDVLTNILSRMWSNTNKEVSGYFQTKYTNADGSYAQIWNESDGGGSLYENKTAGIKTYVGVNADGADGVCAQIYSKNVSTNVGSRLNVNPNGIFYGVGNRASMKPEEELAVKGDVANAVDGLASEEDIPTKVSQLTNDAGYLTEHQSLDAYAKKEDLATVATTGSYNDLINKPENVSEFTNDAGYLTEHQSLDAYINSVSYDSENKQIQFKHDDTILDTVDATPFIKDGMITSVAIDGGNLVITFNTDAGKEPISIALTDIFNPANYYTKNEADAEFATKDESETGDNDVLTNILGRIWSNTNKVVSGYFQTRYTNADGSYAQIWNESDGGGSLYENKTAGIKSFVGVNADDADGVCVQIYSKNVSTNVGSRLNVNPNGIFYGVGNSASMNPEEEISVKGDLTNLSEQFENELAQKDETIASLKSELYSLKQVVGNIGGNVTYDMPGEGKTLGALLANNGTVKLSEDVVSSRYGAPISAKNNVTLNLSGHTLEINPTGDYSSILMRGSQTMTIKGSGANSKLINNGNGKILWVASETCTANIESGNFIGNGESTELIYCENGTINITGGTFRNSTEDKRYLLNCRDANFQAGTAKIIISSVSKTTGPKFYDFDPSNNPEGEGTTYVAEGNHVISSVVTEDGVDYTVYTVVKDE